LDAAEGADNCPGFLLPGRKEAGFEGPFVGGKHKFLVKGELRLVLPNPHQGEISKDLLARILWQANLTREQWEKL
jgi:hypothetical protein